MDCIFCKIIKGDIPSYTVYENEYVKCFLDVNPINMGHTLIVPRNVVYATIEGLKAMQTVEAVAKKRGKKVEEIL